MNMDLRRMTNLAAALSLLALAAVPAWSHEGHDHAAPEPVASDPNLVVRSASNDHYEVVLKYRSVPGQQSTSVRVYLSDYATNAPIERARATLRTTSPREVTATGAMVSPGVHEAALPFVQPGRYTMILAIDASPTAEFAFQDLPMGEELVPAQARGRAPTGGLPWWLIGASLFAVLAMAVLVIRRRSLRPISRTAILLVACAGGVALQWRGSPADEGQRDDNRSVSPASATVALSHYMPKESQFLLGVRTIVGQLESLRGRINAVGHVVPESGALASVEAPRDGMVEGVGRRLTVGDRVRQGRIIANLLVIDRLPIRAPISGLVAEVNFSSGQWVQAGDPLVVILDERRVRVELPLFGENLNLALRTRQATVTTSALPGTQFPARVRGLAPTAPEPMQSTESPSAGSPIPPLILTVENRGGQLRPGMLVEVSLELPTADQLIAVPESAVIQQEDGAAVFVHTGAEVFERRPVRIVGRYVNRVGLSGEVRPGDRIVVAGAQALVSAPPVTTRASPDSAKVAP